jgi:hypothetical protein
VWDELREWSEILPKTVNSFYSRLIYRCGWFNPLLAQSGSILLHRSISKWLCFLGWEAKKLHLMDQVWYTNNKGVKGKGKAVPLQAWTDPQGPRRLKPPDFLTSAHEGGRLSAFTPRINLVLIFRGWVDPRAHGTVRCHGKKLRRHRELIPGPSDLQRSTLTTTLKVIEES